MRKFELILQVFHTVLLVSFISLPLKAQSSFYEGTLTYKADTVKRLEAFPAAYIVSQLIVYKKQDLLRIEVWRINKFNKMDIQKDIQIRNKKGTYMYIESADSMMSVAANALFMSYEDEKLHQAERILQGYTSNYKVDKVVKNTKWLNLPAEKVILKGGIKNELFEMVITNTIDIPIEMVFDSLGVIPGTPLQFIIHERGWTTRLTAISLKSEKISDILFQVDPKRKIISLEEMMKGISDFK